MGCDPCCDKLTDENSKNRMEKSIDEKRTNSSIFEDTEIEENYYFSYPEKNNYGDEELLVMNIIDLSLGIHKTIISTNKLIMEIFLFIHFFM